jgi:hypothetical protein
VKVESVETLDCAFTHSDHNPVKVTLSHHQNG